MSPPTSQSTATPAVSGRGWKMALLSALAVTGVPGLLSAATPPPVPIAQTSTQASQISATHPLDPLSAQEIQSAVSTIESSDKFAPGSVFPIITLQEPPKQAMQNYHGGDLVPRQAFAVVYDQSHNQTVEAVVDLSSGRIASWNPVADAQPALGGKDYSTAADLVAKDDRWLQALKQRGITDYKQVYVDTWAMGPSDNPQWQDHRLARTLAFYQGDGKYPYGRPIEGLQATVDLTNPAVLEVVNKTPIPIPPGTAAYDQESVGPLRAPLHPLQTTQPGGPNYTVNGNEVRWQNWKFRVHVEPREGPVFHQISYQDGQRERPIMYRMSLSEMMVPYGDAEDTWSWRSAFDVGEYGFGRRASPLQPGVDVPENATFLNGVFPDSTGKPYEVPRAVAIYERDDGVLWKHYDNDNGKNESRRGTALVVTFSTAVGNYDYMFNYIFHQDGSMEVKADLTGIMLAKGVNPGQEHMQPSGHAVENGVIAPHHQHFFNFRMDFDVDGTNNSVVEMNTKAIPPGPDNPRGNAFTMTEEVLPTEKAAQRDMSLASNRKWIVINPNTSNALGHPTGYALLPGENTVPYEQPDNVSRQRAGFINHHLWVTRYDASQMYAAGDYPNQSRGGDGLPRWTAEDKPIDNTDVVVWYTMGVTHIPRPEEWPVMPAAHIGFKLVPVGFFNRNPALDLPASPN